MRSTAALQDAGRKILSSFIYLALIVVLVGFFIPTASAQEYNSLIFQPQIHIPVGGSGFEQGNIQVGSYNETTGKMTSDLLARYIKVIYNYGMMIAGILGAIVLMGGGVLWLTSSGSDTRVQQAKELILGSLVGLVILFCSWLLLNTINPELLKMKTITTQVFWKADYFCCQYKDPLSLSPGQIRAAMLAEDECKKKNGGTVYKPTKNVLGKTVNYNVDEKQEKCTLPGCCISRLGNQPDGRITKCSNTMHHNCSFGYFMEVDCQFVPEEIYADGSISSCKGRLDLCATAGNGDDCYEDQGTYDNSSCYDGICWHGNGEEGQPCGKELYSKCDADKEQDGKTCDGDKKWFKPGRNCKSGLECCKFNANGTRIND